MADLQVRFVIYVACVASADSVGKHVSHLEGAVNLPSTVE